MNRSLVEKTYDVKTNPDILQILKGQFLLHSREYNLVEYLSTDIELLERRSKLFYDTTKIPGLREAVHSAIESLQAVSQIIRMQSNVGDDDRGLYSVKQLTLYFETINLLYEFYSDNKNRFTSPDYVEWFDRISEIAESKEYTRLKRNTQKLIDQISTVKSISIGFNFDASLMPYEAGILSINPEYIKSGSLIDRIMRLNPNEDPELLSFSPLVIPQKVCTDSEYEVLNYSLYASLSKTFKKAIRQWEPEINNFLKKNLGFLLDNLQDLKFVSSVTDIIYNMESKGFLLSKPIYCPMEEKRFCAQGLYNPALAMDFYENGVDRKVVKNDISMDAGEGIFLLTGANNGGKSVFMCAIGLSQIMAQLGMPVAADRLEISPADALFVELPTYNSLNRDGRFAEECRKIQTIFRNVSRHSMLLLDELFSSTDPVEAVAFSCEILKAMSFCGIRGMYSTHFHTLSEHIPTINTDSHAQMKIDYLVTEVQAESEKRTYRIVRRPPDGKSYALSIANQFGISCEQLMDHRNPSATE